MKKILFPIDGGINDIVQFYGANVQFYRERFGITAGHNGIDIVSSFAAHGAPIYCSESGVVIKMYGTGVGSVSAGFGVWVLGDPDENGVCNVRIYWHMMSNLRCKLGQRVEQGDVLGYMGASGAVYVNGQPVPDALKGQPPNYLGTHLHWGKMRVKRCKTTTTLDSPTLAGMNLSKAYVDEEGYIFEVLDYDNGNRGCVDPMLDDIVYYNEWLAQKGVEAVAQGVAVAESIPDVAERRAWYQFLIDFLMALAKGRK